jgi:hypothetical protein
VEIEESAAFAAAIATACHAVDEVLPASQGASAAWRCAMTWDGRPENPERANWPHIFCDENGTLWLSRWTRRGGWEIGGGMDDLPPSDMAWLCQSQRHRYLGPCLTPAEIAARERAAREKALREAAQLCEHSVGMIASYSPAIEEGLAAAILALLDKEAAP